jgi:hypothetical protein
MLEQAPLVTHGWQQSLSGRWWHPSMPTQNGRRRLFTTADALALLDADPSKSTTTIEEPA